MSAKREAEISQLRAVAAGRLDAVRWSPTERGDHWSGFPALGLAVLHCAWETTPDRRVEYGGVVTRASRGVWVRREADPCEALAALARLALEMGGVPARPSGGATLHVVRAAGPPAVAGVVHDGRPAMRLVGL